MVSLKKSTNTITLRPTIITPKDWDILDKIEAYLNGVEAGAAPGLFSRALVGSAERTLQGEVFHALRTSAYGTQTVLEANVSDWNDLLRRNIDVSVFDNYPAQKTGTFIELGHYTHAQPNPPRNILIKIHEDFAKQLRSKQTLRNKQCIATPTSCSGGTLHCMFVTALDSELPPNGVKNLESTGRHFSSTLRIAATHLQIRLSPLTQRSQEQVARPAEESTLTQWAPCILAASKGFRKPSNLERFPSRGE